MGSLIVSSRCPSEVPVTEYSLARILLFRRFCHGIARSYFWAVYIHTPKQTWCCRWKFTDGLILAKGAGEFAECPWCAGISSCFFYTKPTKWCQTSRQCRNFILATGRSVLKFAESTSFGHDCCCSRRPTAEADIHETLTKVNNLGTIWLHNEIQMNPIQLIYTVCIYILYYIVSIYICICYILITYTDA